MDVDRAMEVIKSRNATPAFGHPKLNEEGINATPAFSSKKLNEDGMPAFKKSVSNNGSLDIDDPDSSPKPLGLFANRQARGNLLVF